MEDMINHPPHYTHGDIEVWDFIHDQFGEAYLLGNIVKYVCRCNHKGTKLKDLQKARTYLNKVIDLVETEEAEESSIVLESDKVPEALRSGTLLKSQRAVLQALLDGYVIEDSVPDSYQYQAFLSLMDNQFRARYRESPDNYWDYPDFQPDTEVFLSGDWKIVCHQND